MDKETPSLQAVRSRALFGPLKAFLSFIAERNFSTNGLPQFVV